MENTGVTKTNENTPNLRKTEWKFFFGIFGIALLLIVMGLIELFFYDIINLMAVYIPGFKDYYNSISMNDKRTIINMLFTTISMGVPTIIGMIIFLQKPNKVVPIKKVPGSTFAALVFFGVGISTLANRATAIISTFVEYFGLSTEYTDPGMGNNAEEMILRTVSIAVLPAIFEELVFRGAILQGLRKFSCDSFAIFFSAFLFGLVHGNVVQIPFAFLLGIYLARITVYSNSILPAMTIHFINNFMSSIASILLQCFNDSIVVSYLYSAVILALTILGVILIVKLSKKDNVLFYTQPNTTLISEKKMWLIALANIGILACIGYYGYQAVSLMMA